MPLLPTELKWYYPEVVDDTSINGGGITSVRANKDSVLPMVSNEQALRGGTLYRKLFLALEVDDDQPLEWAGVFLHQVPVDTGVLLLIEGSHTDTQGDLLPGDQRYGLAKLSQPASPEDSVVYATISDGYLGGFPTTARVMFFNESHEEIHYNTTCVVDGTELTITLGSLDKMLRPFSVGDSVSAVLPLGDIQATHGTVQLSSAGGAFNSDHLGFSCLGSISAVFTLDFTSATEFVCTSPSVAESRTGNINADFIFPNLNKSRRPYFIVRAAAWSGVFVAGNSVSIETVGAYRGIWLESITLPHSDLNVHQRCSLGVTGV